MTRRLLMVTMMLAACGGRAPVATQPVPSLPPAAPPPPPAATAAVAAADTARPALHPEIDTRRTVPQKGDSVADAQALDSLAALQAASALPELALDSASTWDLDVASFADQPRVKYYLDYFTGRARDRFQVWLDRMGHYEAYAREQFAARKLPGDFVYLALIESGFSPEAVSRASAVGMWQFMIGTGRLYGLRVDTWVDERRDPIKSTDAAAHHLDDLTQHFGSHYLAAAAYNAGAGRVERGLGRIGTPGATAGEDDSTGTYDDNAFFSLADSRLIRDETKNYVPQLIAAAIIAKQPNKYGFDAPLDVTPFSRDSVVVDGGTGLDLIARLAHTSLDAMHDLNPNLLRMITPPGAPYPVRVPSGTADSVAAAYAALSPDDRHAISLHAVRAGETVTTLSKKFGVSAEMIRAANRSARGRSIPAGTMLVLPVSTTIPAALLREPDPPRTTRTTSHTVVVKSGESIASVAKRAGVSVATLRSQNGLSAKSVLRAGQRLTVQRTVVVRDRAAVAAVKVPARAADPMAQVRTHVVRQGETLTAIAREFHVSTGQIIAINGLDSSGALRAGQTLKIPHG